MTNHNNVRSNLLQLLKVFPRLVEDYNNLLMHYWAFYDGVVSMDGIPTATPAETVTRNLRRLVELGLVEVPDRIKLSRKEKQTEFQTEFKSLM